VKAQDLGTLLVLSALWGGSFLCMRIASPVLGPLLLVELRVLIAGLALLFYTLMTRTDLHLRAYWRHYLVIGIVNSAIPFTLIATAELHLTAGLAAIVNATSPLFGAVVAALWMKEVLPLHKGVGLLLGIVGVALSIGWGPIPLSTIVMWSAMASVGAAACYGIAGVYIKVHMQHANTLALSTCSQLGACLFLLPFTVGATAWHGFPLHVLVAVIILGVFCTAIAYLLYFRLIKRIGPTKALTVTFLSPVFGVLWGVVVLHEPLTWNMVGSFAIILIGVRIVTGNYDKKHN
jgi:drug/metabolite transporter (DMT)-like permease